VAWCIDRAQSLMKTVRKRVAALALVAAAFAGACASTGEAPKPTGALAGDPVLEQGRVIYHDRCARCHGRSGGGGAGPKLSGGNVRKRYPDPAAVAAVVSAGRGAMPAWKDTLSPTEIDAVSRYVFSVL
jgi:cytochrome c oxidase cbb3-type subunit 3